jgi:hypothetical protein
MLGNPCQHLLRLFLTHNAAVKWAAKKRSGFADPSSTACYDSFKEFFVFCAQNKIPCFCNNNSYSGIF